MSRRITILLLPVMVLAVLLAGCNSPNPEVLKRSRPNITAFLSSYSRGFPMPASVFAETITVTRVGDRFDDVKKYSPSSYVSHWSSQFFDWQPLDFSATIVSELEVATPPGHRNLWHAQFVVSMSYERSDTNEQRNETWTFTTNYYGLIASIVIDAR